MKQFLINLQAKQRSERANKDEATRPFLEAFEQFGELLGKFCVPDTFYGVSFGVGIRTHSGQGSLLMFFLRGLSNICLRFADHT